MTPDPLAEFKALSQRSDKKVCPVPEVLSALNKQDQDLLEQALGTPESQISNAGVARWIERHAQVKLKWQSIRTHRVGSCTCYDG